MDIHRSQVKDFVMPKVKSVFVIDYYERIQGMLASRGDFKYRQFFANPRVRTQTEIIWSTDVFSGRPSLLCDIQGELKNRYAIALKERIEALEALIEDLKSEADGAALAELLSKAISCIGENSVYCGGGNLVVVNWGLIPRRSDIVYGSIYRSGKFVGVWNNVVTDRMPLRGTVTNDIDYIGQGTETDVPPSVSSIEQDQVIHATVPDNPVVYEAVVSNDVSSTQSERSAAVMDAGTVGEETESEIDASGVRQSPLTTEVIQEDTSDKTNGKVEESSEENKREGFEEQVEEDFSKERLRRGGAQDENGEEYSWSSFFGGLGKGLKFFLGKIWWLFLLPLIVVGALFLTRSCHGPLSEINPFYNPLPKNPRVLPVGSDAVGLSEDGMTKIATDRLNVILEKENEDTMLEWAKAFKRKYSGSEYEIFYYNEELYMLQIKVPSAQREQIKAELKQQLSGFSFDVYDETVFSSDATSYNDPELSNVAHAWYLHAIGASQAWSITTGDSGVVVAIVDNGFDLSHPELLGKVVSPFNVLSQDANLRPIFTKKGENAHGTHVAATAVGNCNNGQGLLGIAPNCKLMPIQVGNDHPEGCMSNTAIIEGVLYAISQGADVVNLSLGMAVPDELKKMSVGQQLNFISSSMKQEELLWNKIFQKASQRNCIIVFAAGNDDMISGIDPKKRSNQTIRVSALNTSLHKAYFSNYGRFPQINREYSSVSAPGVAIYSASPHGNYMTMDGTSMAAPIVTGAVALLKSINKNLTVDQAISILKETGKEVDPSIGPLIHVGNAVKYSLERGDNPGKCEEIAKQVQRLRAQIDSLCQLCPDAGAPTDTLKYKDAIRDRGLDGLWKTTTELVSVSDNTPVELFMWFKQSQGTLTIKNKGDVFTAPLSAKIEDGKIYITQHEPSRSKNSTQTFNIYSYECFSDRKGNLMCKATNASGVVEFNLIRVK